MKIPVKVKRYRVLSTLQAMANTYYRNVGGELPHGELPQMVLCRAEYLHLWAEVSGAIGPNARMFDDDDPGWVALDNDQIPDGIEVACSVGPMHVVSGP